MTRQRRLSDSNKKRTEKRRMSQTEGVIKGKLLESVKARTQFKFPRRLCIPIMTLIPLISKDC